MDLQRPRHGVLLVRDSEGRRHAVRATAVLAVHELDDPGTTALSLPAGKLLILDAAFEAVVDALEWPRPA
ncbi:hypothetical protein [Azospirillum sp. sgz301742]